MEQQYAVLAIAPGGATMVASVHPSKREADTEATRQTERRPAWTFAVEVVTETE